MDKCNKNEDTEKFKTCLKKEAPPININHSKTLSLRCPHNISNLNKLINHSFNNTTNTHTIKTSIIFLSDNLTIQTKEEILTTINSVVDYVREVTIKVNLFIIYHINVQLEYVYIKTRSIISNIPKNERGIKAFFLSQTFCYACTQLVTSDQSKPTIEDIITNSNKKMPNNEMVCPFNLYKTEFYNLEEIYVIPA